MKLIYFDGSMFLQRRMEASEWDHATLREEEFEQHAVYLVPDVAASPSDTNRAEASLPRNLVLKPSQALNDVRSSAKESYLETSSVRAACASRVELLIPLRHYLSTRKSRAKSH